MGLPIRKPVTPGPLSPARLEALEETQAAGLVRLARSKGLHSRRERFFDWMSKLFERLRFRRNKP